jgi:ubiquinone/menaquinone biosynthesis C-methylase UbiE
VTEQFLSTGHSASFDKAAVTYDEDFERLPGTRRLRRTIWNTYYKYFRPGEHLLELNCGTGTDAIELASNGIHIFATDASAAMLRMTEKKVSATGLHKLIETRQVTFQKLRTLRGKSFDGAYSNFGGLNCTRYIDDVAVDLSSLIKPGGFLVMCILSRFSLWESISFGLRGQFLKATRRFARNGALADVHGEKVWVHYYTPPQVAASFGRYFVPIESYGLNIFSPPPTSRRANALLGPLVLFLEWLDKIACTVKPFYAMGDHFVIVLQRKQ